MMIKAVTRTNCPLLLFKLHNLMSYNGNIINWKVVFWGDKQFMKLANFKFVKKKIY
jgi:hypothetical protein